MRKGSERRVGKLLCVDRSPAKQLRLGITASNQYGSAPERNRFKRLVREAFRTSYHHLPQKMELNVIPRSHAKTASYHEVVAELLKLCC
jgi:ribonuclease P protein component